MGGHWDTFVHNLYSNTNLCVICILASLSPSLIHMPTFTEIGFVYSTEAFGCEDMTMPFVTRIPRFIDDWTVRFSARARVFSLHSVQSASGAHPTDIGALSLLQRAVNYSPPSNIEIKNLYTCISTPPSVFMVWCLIKYRNSCPLYLLVTIV